MDREHRYATTVEWMGNDGTGTSGYRAYRRDHVIDAPGKAAAIAGSADAQFRGDATRWNPEELLVAALSSCHMLAFLHLCADAGIVVTEYRDAAEGRMTFGDDGAGQFVGVVLRPQVTLADPGDRARADALHEDAHALCFIARSVNFPVVTEPADA